LGSILLGILPAWRDLAEAEHWYRKAAEQGNAESECVLGQIYSRGWGVQRDAADASVGSKWPMTDTEGPPTDWTLLPPLRATRRHSAFGIPLPKRPGSCQGSEGIPSLWQVIGTMFKLIIPFGRDAGYQNWSFIDNWIKRGRLL